MAKQKVHILMVSGEAPPMLGGVGAVTHMLLLEMARLRPQWRLTWLSRRPRWFHAPASRLGPIRMLRPAHGWDRTGIRLSQLAIQACRPSLVHIQDEEYSYFHSDATSKLADVCRVPLVATLHEFHQELQTSRYTAELAQRANYVIANDQRTADRCRDHAGRAPDQVLWSVSTVTPPPPSPEIRVQPCLIAWYGLIGKLKMLDLAHAALLLLKERYPELRWQVTGPFDPATNPERAELRRQIQGDWVEFLGSMQDDPLGPRRLAEARLMILPFSDGASVRRTSLQVAWAYGLPVVTTPPQAHEPSIVDGRNCLLVHDSTPEAWAAAVERILREPELERQLRAGSLATAEHFSVARQAAIHVELYESLLAKQSSQHAAPAHMS